MSLISKNSLILFINLVAYKINILKNVTNCFSKCIMCCTYKYTHEECMLILYTTELKKIAALWT